MANNKQKHSGRKHEKEKYLDCGARTRSVSFTFDLGNAVQRGHGAFGMRRWRQRQPADNG
jgi:hypothetical protein